MKNTLYLFIICLYLSISELKAQQLEWVLGYESDSNYSYASCVSLDSYENVYTLGEFYGTIDFDPGPAIYNLSSSLGSCYIQKLDQDGNFIWIKQFWAVPSFIKSDTAGNIYLSGFFSDTIDVDPGPGVYHLIANGPYSPFMLKLDTNGEFLWAFDLKTPNGRIEEIEIAGGSVFAVGYFTDTLYMPADTIISLGETDAFYFRLDPAGNMDWLKIIGGHHRDQTRHIKADHSGSVFISGFFRDTVDLDAGTGTFNIISPTAALRGTFLAKIDLDGNFLWGTSLKSAHYPQTQCLVIDHDGNVILSGKSTTTEDFDPGPGFHNIAIYDDLYLLKLSNSGDFIWVRVFEGTGQSYFEDIGIDAANSIYVIGFFNNTFDYDPGPGQLIDSVGSFTYTNFVEKIDHNGSFVWVEPFTAGYLHYMSLNSVNTGHLYMSGSYRVPTDFAPGPDEFYLNASSDHTAFVAKWSNPVLSAGSTEQPLKVSCFPNPTTGVLHLNFSEDNISEVKVYNPLGEMVQHYAVSSNTLQVSLDGTKGIYYVEAIEENGARKIFKIIKQ